MATIKTNRSGACWFRRPGPDNISLELVRLATSILKEFGYWHGPTAIGSICCGDEARIRSWRFANVGSDGSEITHRQLVTRLLLIPFRPAVGLQELYKSVMIAGFLLRSDLAVPGGQNSARSKPASLPLTLSIWRCSRSPARKARGSERVAVAPYLMRRCVASVFC